MRALLAIPCYNCEKQIKRVIAGFNRELASRLEKIVVIDNRSSDSTVNSAIAAVKASGLNNIEVISNSENYGLGGTHKVAFLYAERLGMDYVGILHGDNQAKTEELFILLDEAENNPRIAAILGSRFMSGSRLDGYSPLRIWGNRGLNILYAFITLRKTMDIGSGLNLFRIKDILDRRYLGFSDGFTFNIDLLLDYYKKGSKIKFIPITWTESDQVSNAKTFAVGWIALKTVLRWRFLQPLTIEKKEDDYSFQKVYV
mgnify:CR=1 FL=1